MISVLLWDQEISGGGLKVEEIQKLQKEIHVHGQKHLLLNTPSLDCTM